MEYQKKLLERLTEFYATGTFCDYVMLAGNERISVHKVIMAACSDYFYAMVTSDMKEKGENTITLDAIDGVGLRAVVDFAYSVKVTIDLDNLSSILQAASYLQVQGLVAQCEAYVKQIIQADNCVLLTPIIEMYGIGEKYPDIANYIFEHFHYIPSEHYNFLSLEQLVTILSDDRLKAKSETHLVTIVKDWMMANKHCVFDCPPEEIHPEEEPWVTFTLLMSEIRWCLLSEEELLNIDEGVQSVMDVIPTCQEILHEAKCYHADIYRQPFMQNLRSRVRCDSMQLVLTPEKFPYSSRVFDITSTRSETHDSKLFVEYTSDDDNYNIKQKAISFNNFLFVCGGEHDTNYTASKLCVRYDPRFNKWHNMASMNFARYSFVLVIHGNRLYVVGGIKKAQKTIDTCETYDIEADAWSIIPPYHSSIADHAGCVVGDNIYISGGFHYPETQSKPDISPYNMPMYQYPETQTKSDVFRYNIPTCEWHPCAAMMYARKGHIMEGEGDVIHVIGGQDVDTIERYSIAVDQWTNYCKQTISIAYCRESFVSDGKIFILGKRDDDNVMMFSERYGNIIHDSYLRISVHDSVENLNGSTVLSIPFHLDRYDSHRYVDDFGRNNQYDSDDYDEYQYAMSRGYRNYTSDSDDYDYSDDCDYWRHNPQRSVSYSNE